MNYTIQSDKVLFTQIGHEGVLYGTEKGEYLSLNETFLAIYKGIEGGKSQDEIVQDLLDTYEIDEHQVQQAVSNSIQQLLDKGFIACSAN